MMTTNNLNIGFSCKVASYVDTLVPCLVNLNR